MVDVFAEVLVSSSESAMMKAALARLGDLVITRGSSLINFGLVTLSVATDVAASAEELEEALKVLAKRMPLSLVRLGTFFCFFGLSKGRPGPRSSLTTRSAKP